MVSRCVATWTLVCIASCSQLFGLHDRSWKVVKNKATTAFRTLDGVLNDTDYNLVGHKCARLHRGFDLFSYVGASSYSSGQDVAHSQVAEIVLVFVQRRLCNLCI